MMLQFTYSQLISTGVHIGHSLLNTPLLASWILFGFRQNTWFINLFKTFYMFKLAFQILKYAVSHQGPIWFINLNKATNQIIKFAALRCGEFFASTYWIKGMLSNFKYALASFSKLINVDTNLIKNPKINKFLINFENWYLTRFAFPRVVFISSAYYSPMAVREALCFGVPCLGIVDTNISGHAVTLPIPGNDDSIEALIFYNEIVSNIILLNKFSSVFNWFMGIRKSSRLVGFTDWLKHKKRNLKSVYKNYLKRFMGFANYFSGNYTRLLLKSLNSYLSINYWIDNKVENLQFLTINTLPIEKVQIFSKFSLNWVKYLNVTRTYFLSQLIRRPYLILRSRKRKSVKLFKARAKKFLLRRFLPKTKAFVFFRTGQYIYKVLSYKSKNYFNFESNAGPYHLFVNSFLSQRIKLLKSIVKSPFNKDWNLPYLSRLQSTLKYKISKILQKKYAILLKNKTKYVYTRFFSHENENENEKIYFFHAYLINMYLRLIFNDLNYKYKFKFKNLVSKFNKKIVKKNKLKKKKNCFIRIRTKAKAKLSFASGWLKCKNFIISEYWVINALHFFSDRLPIYLIWYFLRFYRVNITSKLPYIYSFYKGPAFFKGIYNVFFQRALLFFERYDSNEYQESFSYLNYKNFYLKRKTQWYFFSNLNKILPKVLKKLITVDFFLSNIYDRRFDFIRKFYFVRTVKVNFKKYNKRIKNV